MRELWSVRRVLVVCGAIFYSNRQQAKERVVEQISDVATLTLGDQKMQAQAQQAQRSQRGEATQAIQEAQRPRSAAPSERGGAE